MSGNLVVCSGFGTRLIEANYITSEGKDVGAGGNGFWMRSALISLVDNVVVGWCGNAVRTWRLCKHHA